MARFFTTTLAAGGAVASLLAAQPAHACGGFFCDNTQPVNQAAERIIFSQAEDGTVTATIQIQYAGEADAFAWVLPVAGNPEVRVSSNLAFQRLQAATNPQYLLTTRIEGSCRDAFRGGPTANGGVFTSDAGASAPDAGGPPVTVVNQGTVGPYDFVTIAVDPATARPSDTAVEWLRDNGYQVDERGAELLDPYLAGGMNLLAFRLTKGNATGSIRPVQIVFGSGQASIPIRPTAVAAVADMGVMVWVLGPHRAVPVNYTSLELNEALINWLNPNANYNDVVTRAADEAGGQGFVTEMAGAASPLADTIFASRERGEWSAIQADDWTGREGELLMQVVNQYAGFDGMRDVLAATVPLPADRPGTTYEDLLSCIGCYYDWSDTDIAAFEPASFLASVETNVMEPMERTRALFVDSAYMTRLYTTMSAEEMTRDPAFDFNPDLADVSNIHNAERVIECSPSLSQGEAPWRLELPSGETVRGTGGAWPFSAADTTMPANARIRRYETSGEGEIVVDNVASIGAAITSHNATIPRPAVGIGGGGGLCSVSHAGHSDDASRALGVLALAGLALVLRRRSR
jgi:MYXO-CTERM domain-containing protein